jgi:hypothetical protein
VPPSATITAPSLSLSSARLMSMSVPTSYANARKMAPCKSWPVCRRVTHRGTHRTVTADGLERPCEVLVAWAGRAYSRHLVVAAPSGAATKTGGCGEATGTAVDFVYSGRYKATGLYEFAWVTNPGLGEVVESFFGLSTKEAYFFGVESFGFLDKNGDQVLCVSWLGANPGIDDYYLSVVDNNAAS